MLRCRADFAAGCEALGAAAAIKLPSPDNSTPIDHQRSTGSRVPTAGFPTLSHNFPAGFAASVAPTSDRILIRREWEQRHEKSFAGNHPRRRRHLLGALAFCGSRIRVFDVSDPGELG